MQANNKTKSCFSMGNNAMSYIFKILNYSHHIYAQAEVMSMFKHERVISTLNFTIYADYYI